MNVTPQPDSAAKALAFLCLLLAGWILVSGVVGEFRQASPTPPVKPRPVQQPHRSQPPVHKGATAL
jgi:hypothetical protein